MDHNIFDLIVIGGGAAGFFGAIQAAEKKPGQRIMILEKSSKLLSKVKISGGGRCNVTHNCFNAVALSRHYPRGEKQLKQLFKKYQAEDVVEWFNAKGVMLKAESDGRMFPSSDDSQTIIDCFILQSTKYNIQVELNFGVINIVREKSFFTVAGDQGKQHHAKKSWSLSEETAMKTFIVG